MWNFEMMSFVLYIASREPSLALSCCDCELDETWWEINTCSFFLHFSTPYMGLEGDGKENGDFFVSKDFFFSIRSMQFCMTINRSFNLTSKKESLTKWYRCKSNDLDFIHSSECNISHTHTNTHTHTIFLQSSLQIENPAKWAKKTSQRGGKEAEVGGKRDTLPFVNIHGIWNSGKLICVRLKNLKRVEGQHPPFCQQWKLVTPCRFPESWKETVDDRPNSSFRRRPHK